MSVTWTLFRSRGLLNKSDLHCILGKVDRFHKFIGKFRYVRVKVLPNEFLIDNSSIKVEFREYKAGGILCMLWHTYYLLLKL